MGHFRDMSRRTSRMDRLGRLFELHRQAAVQHQRTEASPLRLRDAERMLQARAIASFVKDRPGTGDTAGR